MDERLFSSANEFPLQRKERKKERKKESLLPPSLQPKKPSCKHPSQVERVYIILRICLFDADK